jgi:hypothetical protein
VFVFLASATVASSFGHGALLACSARPASSEWKPSTSSELVRETAALERKRLALNGEP